MGLFSETTTPQEMTQEYLRDNVRHFFLGMKISFDGIMQMVWRNPYGLMPQQVFDLLGTNGGDLGNMLTPMRTAFNNVHPGGITLQKLVPDGYSISVDASGNVTVTEV